MSSALVKQPVRVTAIHRGQKIIDQVFQHTPIRLGRLIDNDVVLPFDFISRFHCELRFDNDEWKAVDLGSKNGLLTEANARAKELPIPDGTTFKIQELTVHLAFEMAAEISKDFSPLQQTDPLTGTLHSDASRSSAVRKKKSESTDPEGAPAGKRPLLDVDLKEELLIPHPTIQQARERALQMIVLWHDQFLDAREVPVGETLIWDFLGNDFSLGTVKKDKTKIKIPKGCKAVGTESNVVTPDSPLAFRSGAVTVVIRYVPRSHDLAAHVSWIEEKLVHPLATSAAIHGTLALTTLIMAPRHKIKTVVEPERFATILVAATPLPEIALQPTPTPTPLPVVPSPTPQEVAKKVEEKPKEKEIPKVEIKKVVDNKKRKRPALARKEDPSVQHKQPVNVEKKIVEKPTKNQKPIEIVAKNEEPPKKIELPEPSPAPAPTPVFEAKKVGALAMLANLKAGPASEVANVEKIQVSRAPSSVPANMVGREAVNGTGNIESKLNQSAKGGGTGKGDGTTGIAVGGKNAGGTYKTAGLAGKAGNRKIKGSVIGGATYSELSKNEGLSRDQIMKVVQAHQSQIQACYERALMGNPDLVGRAEFEWEITPKGSVTIVKVKEATVRNGENLLDCVKGIISKMQFPVAKNGEATTPTIGLPFGRL